MVTTICPFCSQDLENAWHIFVSCPFARSCWCYSLIEDCSNVVEGFRKLVFKMLSVTNELIFGKVVMTLWSIWRERNNQVWSSKHNSTDSMVRAWLEVLCDWVVVKTSALV